MKPRNIVGPQIRRIRYNLGWSQEKLARQLEAFGLEVRREFVAKIEGQTHRVDDKYLPYFAATLSVSLADLFPRVSSPIPAITMRQTVSIKRTAPIVPMPLQSTISSDGKV